MTSTSHRPYASARVAGIILLAALATSSPGIARAVEIIPSLGFTRSMDTNAGDAKALGGIAIRAALLPFLKAEGGIGYRQDSFANDDVKMRQWPVTASLWFSPLPMVYAGGGFGWYRTTLDYRDGLPFENSTSLKTGVHLGGGLEVPIAPRLGLDLNGRYIFMQKGDESAQLPTTFNPDFWTTSVGLAIHF
jgi:hypothetical protein